MITVVIPYYQKAAGVLRKALTSIASQRDCSMPVHVIVVDDASPIPASSELLNLDSASFTIEVITQANAGPGAARNTGLDRAPAATRYLAFLDSDDEWTPDHLARAVAALDAGHTFYFSDHFQLGQTTGAFERGGKIKPEQHTAMQGLAPGLYAYQRDMLDQIIRGNVIGTSTVVYDFTRFKQKRFKAEFTNAGEDYLFWMDLVHEGAKIAFSTTSEARYGRGVNVYSGSGWGSDGHLLRIHNEMKYRKLTQQLFPLTSLQQSHISDSLKTLRSAFARDLLHRASHRKAIPLGLLTSHMKMDPKSFLLLPATWLRLLLKMA